MDAPQKTAINPPPTFNRPLGRPVPGHSRTNIASVPAGGIEVVSWNVCVIQKRIEREVFGSNDLEPEQLTAFAQIGRYDNLIVANDSGFRDAAGSYV